MCQWTGSAYIYLLVANHDKTLIPNTAPLIEPPVLKGYLNKYTNVAKGYNTRWFVLKGGVLSCTFFKPTSRIYLFLRYFLQITAIKTMRQLLVVARFQ